MNNDRYDRPSSIILLTRLAGDRLRTFLRILFLVVDHHHKIDERPRTGHCLLVPSGDTQTDFFLDVNIHFMALSHLQIM